MRGLIDGNDDVIFGKKINVPSPRFYAGMTPLLKRKWRWERSRWNNPWKQVSLPLCWKEPNRTIIFKNTFSSPVKAPKAPATSGMRCLQAVPFLVSEWVFCRRRSWIWMCDLDHDRRVCRKRCISGRNRLWRRWGTPLRWDKIRPRWWWKYHLNHTNNKVASFIL